MESYKCDVCSKSFTGLVCYQQHEASEKHKKKVRMSNGTTFEIPKVVHPDTFHCPVCMVSISGLDNYQKHVISLDHALKVQIKNGDLLSQSVSSTFELKNERNQPIQNTVSLTSPMKAVAPYAECKPCQKQFSGPEPYQQHLVSAGHKKKCGSSNESIQSNETNFNNVNKINDSQSFAFKDDANKMVPQPFFDQSVSSTFGSKTENQPMEIMASSTSPIKALIPYAECKPCQKQFSGPEPYQQHLVSAGHKKKCGSSIAMMQSDETDFRVEKECLNNNTLYDPQSSVSEGDINKTVPQISAKCDICKMEFNGLLPYQIHLVSDGHKKQLLGNSFSESQSAFKCDLCVMRFSGPVPYQQHLLSNGHKKKTALSKQLAMTGSFTPPDSTLKDNCIGHEQSSMNDQQKWYCNLCKKQCSGPIPYNAHMSSQDHSKNVRVLEVEENLRKIKELSPPALFGNGENDSSLCSQGTSAGLSVEFNFNDLNIDVKHEDTKTLPDKFQVNANDLIALPNLNIIPPEKLDISVFSPDDEIIFSSPKKCNQQFLSKMIEEKKECNNENLCENSCLMVE